MNFNEKKAIANIFEIIKKEQNRQDTHIELIASENFVSDAVLAATGSVLTNKYAEGYPGHRYYGGCEYIDEIENLAIEYAKKLFDCNFANVQAHSGSSANFAVYLALLKPGDTVLGMDINAGGHLTHGTKVSFSGKIYNCISYGVDPKTHLIDYDQVLDLALKHKPKMIIVGASNYSRTIDFKKFKQIADQVKAYLFADMAHIAGLIAAKQHPSCFPYADVMMTTTHKTLRGPRGAIICWNDPNLTKKINSAVFPGAQGGPLENVVGAKAVAFAEALTKDFVNYQKQVIKNAKAFCNAFIKKGIKVLSNGTDNHLFTINVFESYGITAEGPEEWLHQANITTNKNTVPFDVNTPKKPSGIRLGTPAMTTKGFKEADFVLVADWIDQVISSKGNPKVIAQVKKLVTNFLKKKNHL